MKFTITNDVNRLRGGSMRFTFQDIAYQGIIDQIDYVPLGPGGINVQLVSLQPVTEGPAVPDIPLQFTISLFLAEITNGPHEIIVNQLVPQEGFGNIISFHVR